MDQRNANGGWSADPISAGVLWDAFADDRSG
jgi:hypothetical protein